MAKVEPNKHQPSSVDESRPNSTLSKISAVSLFLLSSFSFSSCTEQKPESQPSSDLDDVRLPKATLVEPATVPAAEAVMAYRVKAGDTLWRIAGRVEADPRLLEDVIKSIRSANNLKNDQIRVGQILLLPARQEASEPIVNEGQQQSLQEHQQTRPNTPTPRLNSAEIKQFVRSLLDTNFGSMCRHFESNNNIAARSNSSVDPGGATHGCYQISASTMPDFISHLKQYSKDTSLNAEQRKVALKAYNSLKGHTPASKKFKEEWSRISTTDPRDFRLLQQKYSLETHLLPALGTANKLGFPINKQMAEVYMSLSAQHSPLGVQTILQTASKAGNPSTSAFDKLVGAIYKARQAYVRTVQERQIKKIEADPSRTAKEKATETQRAKKMWENIIDGRYAEELRLAQRLMEST